MSATNTPVIVSRTAPLRVKKPVLSAKFSKFQVFGFWFIENMKNKQIIDDVSAAHSLLTMFSDVPQQALFFEQFLEEFKMANKNMKAAVRLHNKPPPLKKEKKLDTTAATEKKRGRKRKEVLIVNDKQEQLIQDLVAAANGLPTQLEPQLPSAATALTVQEPKPKRKYVRKPKVDTLTNTDTLTEEPKTDTKTETETKTDTKTKTKTDTKTETETKTKTDTKTKTKTDTKTKTKTDTKTETETETKTDTKTETKTDTKTEDTNTDTDHNDLAEHNDELELEIDVEPINIDGQQFLIDAQHNLYHTLTFLPLGTFKNNSIILH
jgi:hypothetical protein